MRTNNTEIEIRAKEAFNKALSAFERVDFAEHERNRNILKEMVRDKCISPEYLRDLDGSTDRLFCRWMEATIDPAFSDFD